MTQDDDLLAPQRPLDVLRTVNPIMVSQDCEPPEAGRYFR
jgi:hypothetical protein